MRTIISGILLTAWQPRHWMSDDTKETEVLTPSPPMSKNGRSEAEDQINTTKAGHRKMRGKLSAGQDGTQPMRSPRPADDEYTQYRTKKWGITDAADTAPNNGVELLRRVVILPGFC